MAGKFKILFVLCLVAPCLARDEISPKEAGSPPAATTTAPPEATTTTAPPAPPEATTTTAPPAPPDATTTTAPPAPPEATTTTAPPDATTTTAPPGATTTTAPPAPPDATTTTAPPGATTTTAPPGATTTTAQSAGTTTTKPTESPDPCASSPCGSGSTCEPRNDKMYVCLCLAGENYNDGTKSCEKAKVFPGELSLKELQYKKEMSDKRSALFAETADKIITEVAKGFVSKPGFSGATVLELLPFSVRSPGVKATVDIIFQANAAIDDKAVDAAIQTAASCKECVLAGAAFEKKSLCESNACDELTATCKSADGSFTCTCKDGYIRTDFSTRMCIACQSGQEAKNGECSACSFGYSGFNCNESWQLVLTIVGSVLSGLLLVTLILLPVVALKSKKTSKKSKEADIGMSQVNQPNTKAPMATSNFSNGYTAPASGPANSFANTGMPKFPRVTATNSNWESKTNLDMTPSNSRQNLIPNSRTSRYDDDDDAGPYAQTRPQSNPYAQTRPQSNLYAQTQPQSNLYAQTRPQSNLYAQTRPQGNPYASSQGQSSSYFAEDVGRRY